MKGRFRSFDFWDGAVFGVTVAAIAALALIALFGSIPVEHWSSVATLVAIPTAGAGALVALAATRYQINHDRQQNLEAARSVLPLVLSRMISVAVFGMKYSAGVLRGTENEVRAALSLDDHQIDILRDCVRNADPVTRLWLKVLIARYQIYFARVPSWCNQPPPSDIGPYRRVGVGHQDAILDWATFHALVEHFYEYARSTADSVPQNLDGERLQSAFFLNLFELEFEPFFQARIERRIEILKDGRIEHFF